MTKDGTVPKLSIKLKKLIFNPPAKKNKIMDKNPKRKSKNPTTVKTVNLFMFVILSRQN